MAKRIQTGVGRIATASLAATPPAFNASQEAGARGRFVFGTFALAAAVGAGASITVEIETGPGTGTYTEVIRASLPTGVVGLQRFPYAFAVPARTSYRFQKSGGAGVTETHALYSFADV